MSLTDDNNIDDLVDDMMSKIDVEEDSDGEQSSDDAEPEEAIGEEKEKTDETEGDEEEKPPIEAPTSWRSEEKEAFASLPREIQDVINRIDHSQQSYFTQRSTELAQKIRAADEERSNFQNERSRFISENERQRSLLSQVLPALFPDIRSEADFLRLKSANPEQANQYEILMHSMRIAEENSKRILQQEAQERLNREWETLLSKRPELRDGNKAKALLDDVRRAAIEYYGYTPEEVSVIPDHRNISVLEDALKWRKYEANQRVAALKKSAPQPTKVLKSSGNISAPSTQSKRDAALLSKAKSSNDPRVQAAYLAKVMGI